MTSIEQSVWRPLLGIAFTDAATGLAVRDGLRVTAQLGRTTHALVRSLDGVAWSLHVDREAPSSLPVLIEDRARRHLPASAVLGPGFSTLPLASAPSRTLPAGHAQVRATVLDRTTRRPLAGLRLQVSVAGRTSTGHADGRGEVLVCVPWPKTPPNLAGMLPLAERSWTVDVTAAAPAPAPASGDRFVLDLAASYGDRVIAANTTGPDALPAQTLRYGHPLVLASEGDKALLIV